MKGFDHAEGSVVPRCRLQVDFTFTEVAFVEEALKTALEQREPTSYPGPNGLIHRNNV